MPRLKAEAEFVNPYDTALLEVQLPTGALLLAVAQFGQGEVFFTFGSKSQHSQEMFSELQRAAVMCGATGHPSERHRDAVRKWLDPLTTTPLQVYQRENSSTVVVGESLYVKVPDTILSREIGEVRSILSTRAHKD